MMRRLLPIFAATAWLLAMTGLAAPQTTDIADLAADIVDVRIFGAWQIEDRSGFYRGVVTVPQPGRATFTLQWISLDPAGGPTAVEHSLPIREMAEVEGIVTGFRGEQEQDGMTVFIDVKKSAEDPEDTYVVFVEGPDAYSFEGAAN